MQTEGPGAELRGHDPRLVLKHLSRVGNQITLFTKDPKTMTQTTSPAAGPADDDQSNDDQSNTVPPPPSLAGNGTGNGAAIRPKVLRGRSVLLALDVLHVDHTNYQRKQLVPHVAKIAREWDEDLLTQPTIIHRVDGTYWIGDRHRSEFVLGTQG